MSKKLVHVSWEEFDQKCRVLANMVKLSGKKYRAVYGIPRGGMPIAVRLSHLLGIDLVESPEECEEYLVHKATEERSFRGKGLLIVDDISDEGKTLSEFMESFDALFDTACLYSTPWTTFEPTYHVSVKDDKESWIVYPWEEP